MNFDRVTIDGRPYIVEGVRPTLRRARALAARFPGAGLRLTYDPRRGYMVLRPCDRATGLPLRPLIPAEAPTR